MSLENVKQIKETTLETEVNEYLSKGYTLLKILSSKIQRPDCEEVRPIYILGLIK